MTRPDHLQAKTYHRRLGETDNRFQYSVDYLLIDPLAVSEKPALFSCDRPNLVSLWQADHGGAIGQGQGVAWVRQVLRDHQLPIPDHWRVLLLAQPRIMGTRFSPVSFWLVQDDQDALRAVIAEVNNTFGERHSYLCTLPDLAPITPQDTITAQKIFHVSPFQPVAGAYRFTFDITANAVRIRIAYQHEKGGVLATLTGQREPLSNRSILSAVLRRPLGSLRVLTLIHMQALKLWRKGVAYRAKPTPPTQEVSQ